MSRPNPSSKRPFAVFDLDGTLIRWQLYHAVADALARLGYFDIEGFRPVREARMLWKRRSHEESFKEYERRLVATYDHMLSSLTVAQFNEAAESVFDEYKDQVYTFTRDLIKQLKARNYLLFAISGSQAEIVGKIADYYGFDDYVGSAYLKKNNRFTGEKILHIGAKHLQVDMLAQKHNASFKGSMAVGDSEGDISMLETVEQPIAFNPSRKLFDYATKNHWKIVVERKNVIYQLAEKQGRYCLII